jgi:hypothetical protein
MERIALSIFTFNKSPVSIKERMSATQAEVATLEASLPQIALDSLVADDDSPARAALDKLADLRTKLEILTHSLSAAEQQEIAKQAEQAARVRKAMQRSASQHAAATDRAARQVSSACEALIGAWSELARTASSLEASLGMTVADEAGFPLLRVKALRREVQAALYRMDAKTRPTLFDRPTGTFAYEHVNETLEGQIAKLTQRAKQSFEATPAPAAPMGKPAEDVAPPVAASVPTAGIAPAPQLERPVYAIDMRGRDLGIEKVFTELEAS